MWVRCATVGVIIRSPVSGSGSSDPPSPIAWSPRASGIFSTPGRGREHANAPELIALLDEIFARHERAHWTSAFTEAGIIFDSATDPQELRGDEQARANDMFVSFDDAPGAGAVAVPFTVRGAESGQHRRAPELGEHSREVLADLGYTSG